MLLKPFLLSLAVGACAALPIAGTAAYADGNAGAYLSARQATLQNDYEIAAESFTRALLRDPSNIELIENAMTAYVALGDFERALPLARRITELEKDSQLSSLVMFANMAREGSWAAVIAGLDEGRTVGPLYDGLLRAWALVGLGQMNDALAQFEAVEEGRGTQAFGLYHRALALASVGDFEGAHAILAGETGPSIRLTPRGIAAHAQVLSQLDRGAEGAALVNDAFSGTLDPFMMQMRDQLNVGETLPFSIVKSAQDGVAEMHFSIANALNGEASDSYTLIYARLASHLRDDHVEATLLTAGLLERLERFELATAVYDTVPLDHPYFHAAELGRADALQAAGKVEAAIEVLTQLGRSHGELPVVHVTLGDTLRRLERFGEATEPYDRAIALIGDPQPIHWTLFFSRAITHEREDRWPQAEADFRKALELSPDQPQVLNYLGYSLVEMQTNLDEALDMIERAVEGQPNSGYITDSLGWVLYRLGRYDEAVVHMERAVELLAIDPIINDHLGDVYWAVGRHREAEFQWHRALSFDPEPEEAERIRRKLEVGLDKVLEEEGAPPLQVANDDG